METSNPFREWKARERLTYEQIEHETGIPVSTSCRWGEVVRGPEPRVPSELAIKMMVSCYGSSFADLWPMKRGKRRMV